MSKDKSILIKDYLHKIKNANKEATKKEAFKEDTDNKSRPMNERRDEKNPDKTLQSRKWIGMEVLCNLKYYPWDDDWEDGEIYDSNTGKEWSSEIWMTRGNLLKVKGYWLFKFISQTKTFKRIQFP